jgi:hypothetical protein
MSKELDKAVGSSAAIASIAAAVIAANSAPVIAAVAALGGATITGFALYHKLSSEKSAPADVQKD